MLESILKQLSAKTLPDSPGTFFSGFTFENAIESAFSMIIITDPHGVIYYANPSVARITGYTKNEVIGKSPRLWGGNMDKEYYQKLWSTITKGQVFSGEIVNTRINGDKYDARIVISPITEDGKVIGYIGTEEDITIQKRLEEEKNEFISIASHQLRTPLGIMKWNLELLEDKHKDLSQEIKMLRDINQYTIDMINNLLRVLRISGNQFDFRYENVVPAAIIQEIVHELSGRIEEKKLHLELRTPELTVTTDASIIREIAMNLIDNAIKYSPEGKTVTVSVIPEGEVWSLIVEDKGIGIPQKELDKVMQKYYRAQNAQKIRGIGLGLYIVNTYLQKLGATIQFESKENQGTRVSCIFPVRPEQITNSK